MKIKPLSRRTLLRGMAGSLSVGLALPALEAMREPKTASAAALPPIFGVFFWGGGLPWHAGHGAEQAVGTDLWTPSGTGPNYTPSELLAPLAPYMPSVATGLTPHTEVPPSPPGQEDGHMRGFMVSLTGDRIRPEGFDHPSHTLTALRPTLDQYVAKHPDFYKSDAPKYSSLVLGVSPARFHDYGHWNAISYNGPDSVNLPIMDPVQLYNLLFSVPADVDLLARRASLLDAVKDDANSLKLRLGSKDRERLESHLDHLNAVQHRLELTQVACEDPGVPSPTEELIAKAGLMGDLLGHALACNLTRAFSFMLTSPATTHVFSNLNVANDFHTTVHNGEWANARAVHLYQMQAFAAMLSKLDALVDTEGATILDRSAIFGLSEYGEGFKHSVSEMPALIVGGCNGALRRGVHTRDVGGNISKVHVTLLRALGIETPSFGFNGGETTEAVSGFLA
jgi:hypothetical protein